MLRGMRPILRQGQGLAFGRSTGASSQRAYAFPRPAVVAPSTSPQLALRTQFSTKPPLQPKGIDKEFEKKVGEKLLEARPDEVSELSSTIPVIAATPAVDPSNQKEVDFGKGLRDDIVCFCTDHPFGFPYSF